MTGIGLNLTKIVGTSTEEAWSQVHTFFPAEEEKKQKRGRLLAVLALTGLGEGVEVVAVGREIIARLHEEYYGHLEGDALTRLKQTVEKVVGEVAPPARAEIGAAAVLGKVLYLVIGGGGQMVLRRAGKIGTLLVGSETVTSASGYLQEGDLFLLGTEDFFRLVSEGVLRAALETDSPQEVVESLAPLVHGHEIDGGEAAVVAKVESLEKKETAAVTEKKPPVKPPSALGSSLIEIVSRVIKLDLPAIFTRISSRLNQASTLVQTRLGKRAVYLTQEKPKRQPKTVFTVALVLFLLLGASVVLGVRQRSHQARQEKVGSLLEQARYKMDEGKSLLDLNPLRSRQLLLEAKDLVEKTEKESGQDPQLVAFKQELEVLLASVLREREIKEAPVFLDLALVKEGAQGDKMAATGDQMVILDKKGASVYGISISQKSAQILAGGALFQNAADIAAFGEKVFVLTPKGIVEVDRDRQEQALRLETDEEWGEIADLFAYGGNLYLLDRLGMIWKYPAIEAGLGSRQRWLKGESQPDFSDSVSLAINGSIWVLKSNGTILKYTQGILEGFGVAGLDKPFSQPVAIYTDDEQENLYILDKSNLRVVVLGKSGEYDSAYIWPGIAGVDDLVVSEAEKKILLLSGSKIYEIGLR
jgi:hypothetical protein